MKISVITASYNCASTLEATIASFRSQNYINKELIIVDGGSTDGSVEIIKSAGKDITRWISEPDLGLYDALNKGIRMAEGDAIGFLHSGDHYAGPEVLEKIVREFQEGKADAVYGDLRYVKLNKREKVIRYWQSGEFYPGLLQKGWMPPHPTFYMKREIYAEHGLYDLSFRIAADYELMLRVLKNPALKIGYIPEVLVEMETGGLSNGRLINIFRKSAEDFRAMQKNGIGNAGLVLLRKNLSKISQFFQG